MCSQLDKQKPTILHKFMWSPLTYSKLFLLLFVLGLVSETGFYFSWPQNTQKAFAIHIFQEMAIKSEPNNSKTIPYHTYIHGPSTKNFPFLVHVIVIHGT